MLSSAAHKKPPARWLAFDHSSSEPKIDPGELLVQGRDVIHAVAFADALGRPAAEGVDDLGRVVEHPAAFPKRVPEGVMDQRRIGAHGFVDHHPDPLGEIVGPVRHPVLHIGRVVGEQADVAGLSTAFLLSLGDLAPGSAGR